MEKMKKIGIILVNYNGLDDTIECINSINKSDYDNYEIIVIDNNSREDATILSNYNHVIYKKLQDNVGFGVANNIGADMAVKNNCELIMCLNNDTVILPDTLQKLSKHTNNSTITTGAIYYYYDKGKLWYGGGKVSKIKGIFRHEKYKGSRKVSFISGCCIMLTADCFKKIGLFDAAYFMYYEDSDFSIKAIRNGYTLLYVYEARVYHKVGKSSRKISGLKDYYLTRNRLYILKKYHYFFKNTAFAYFYITRFLVCLKRKVSREDISYILKGIEDYKKGITGRNDGIN